MYKSLRKILLIISTVILSVVLAACGAKSQTESKQESQPKPLTSQEVVEKYSEAVKNVNSFKYTSDFSQKTATKNPESQLAPYNLESGISKDGVLSSEPFSILTNQTMTITGTSLKLSNYINESNELYTRAGNEPWKKTDSKKTQSEKADVVKKEISNDKFLDALKNVAGDLKLEEQGENYVLTYSGTDAKFMEVLQQFDRGAGSVVNKLADTNILSLNFKLTIKKSSFEPTEIQFDCETGKNESALTTKFTGKRTFSEINTAKVTKPEGIK
ncbi:DUF6612 family protein [Gemella sanguinis]